MCVVTTMMMTDHDNDDDACSDGRCSHVLWCIPLLKALMKLEMRTLWILQDLSSLPKR